MGNNGNNNERIAEVLSEIRPEFDFKDSEDFIGDGMLDSFDIITLVAHLDECCSISIDGMDIVPENFRNMEAISRLVEKSGGRFEF